MKLNVRSTIIAAVCAVIVLTMGAAILMKKKGITLPGGDGVIYQIQTLTQPMPIGGKITHPTFGNQTYFSYGAVSAVTEDLPANGVSYGRVFEDGTYFHTLNLNIEPAAQGSFYQGWLKNEAGEFIKTERLYNRFGDARHGLEFDVGRDLKAYKTVVVSIETQENVTTPTKVVAEGTLKEAKQGK